MAKPKKAIERPDRPRRGQDTSGFWRASADVFVSLIERIGWPGTLVFLVFGFVVKYATPEQKQEIINVYFLGHGVATVYPILALGAVFAGIVLAQRTIYRRRIATLEKEVDRVSKPKSERQTKAIGDDLHHTDVQRKED